MSAGSPRVRVMVLEGLDAAGKTTLAEALAPRLGARLLRTPLPELAGFRERLEEVFPEGTLSRKLFYAAQVARVADGIREGRAGGAAVVVDRYWASTRVYAALRGEITPLREVAAHLERVDLTIYVRAPWEVRRDRILGRGEPADHDRLAWGEAAQGRAEELYLACLEPSWSGVVRVMDTGGRTPAECVGELEGWWVRGEKG